MFRPPSSIRIAAFVLTALAAARSHAQSAAPDELAIIVPPEPPAGFDRSRLLQRIQVYVGPIATVIGDEGESSARFVVQLHWPEHAMTPLDVRVSDTSRVPPQGYALHVSSAQSWDELERLVALKLLSVLRMATAPPAPPPPSAPPQPEPAPEEPASDDGSTMKPLLELGGGVALSSGFDAPRGAGGVRVALAIDRWAFGLASTLTFRRSDGGAGARADVLESTLAASVRHESWRAGSSRWLVQVGAELGLFAARVAGERAGQERTAYALSPLASVLVVGGYRLAADGSIVLLGGPTVDLLWTRSEITAGAARLYDSGHIRYRGELKLVLAF